MRKLTFILSACALTWGAGAFAGSDAQRHGDSARQASHQQQTGERRHQQRGSRHTISGEVVGMRTFAVEDTGEDHAFAKVRLEEGGVAIVDLGPVRDLRDRNVRLTRNQPVTVEGYPGRVNDQPVIVAYALETDRRRADVSQARDDRRQQARADRQRDQRMAQDQRRREETLAGQLVSFRTFDLSNEREPHVFGKVRTNDDRLVVMDLGPVRDLRRQQVDLSRGMQITGRGTAGRINDKPVLVMSLVELDGERYRVGEQRQQTADRQREQRADRQRQQAAHRQDERRARTHLVVMGNLEDARDVSLTGVDDDHRLVKLDTFHGGQVIVDLGKKENVQSLKLRTGDTVVISGQPARINNRPVIRAEQVAEIASITRTR